MELIIPSLDAIGLAARRFIEEIGDRRVFAFYGRMGAGKTTFIKAVCKELGVRDVITSPTFAIINEYGLPKCAAVPAATSVYHFDCYRLKCLEEFLDIGGEEYFYSGNLCFIEWPGIIEPVLPSDVVSVSIEESTGGSRILRFEEH